MYAAFPFASFAGHPHHQVHLFPAADPRASSSFVAAPPFHPFAGNPHFVAPAHPSPPSFHGYGGARHRRQAALEEYVRREREHQIEVEVARRILEELEGPVAHPARRGHHHGHHDHRQQRPASFGGPEGRHHYHGQRREVPPSFGRWTSDSDDHEDAFEGPGHRHRHHHDHPGRQHRESDESDFYLANRGHRGPHCHPAPPGFDSIDGPFGRFGYGPRHHTRRGPPPGFAVSFGFGSDSDDESHDHRKHHGHGRHAHRDDDRHERHDRHHQDHRCCAPGSPLSSSDEEDNHVRRDCRREVVEDPTEFRVACDRQAKNQRQQDTRRREEQEAEASCPRHRDQHQLKAREAAVAAAAAQSARRDAEERAAVQQQQRQREQQQLQQRQREEQQQQQQKRQREEQQQQQQREQICRRQEKADGGKKDKDGGKHHHHRPHHNHDDKKDDRRECGAPQDRNSCRRDQTENVADALLGLFGLKRSEDGVSWNPADMGVGPSCAGRRCNNVRPHQQRSEEQPPVPPQDRASAATRRETPVQSSSASSSTSASDSRNDNSTETKLAALSSISAELAHTVETLSGPALSARVVVDPDTGIFLPHRNRDLVAYEEALLRLLMRADEIQSDGCAQVREARKRVVRDVTEKMEALDAVKKSKVSAVVPVAKEHDQVEVVTTQPTIQEPSETDADEVSERASTESDESVSADVNHSEEEHVSADTHETKPAVADNEVVEPDHVTVEEKAVDNSPALPTPTPCAANKSIDESSASNDQQPSSSAAPYEIDDESVPSASQYENKDVENEAPETPGTSPEDYVVVRSRSPVRPKSPVKATA